MAISNMRPPQALQFHRGATAADVSALQSDIDALEDDKYSKQGGPITGTVRIERGSPILQLASTEPDGQTFQLTSRAADFQILHEDNTRIFRVSTQSETASVYGNTVWTEGNFDPAAKADAAAIAADASRPGHSPISFTHDLLGNGAELAAISPTLIVEDTDGAVIRIARAEIVARREAFRLEEGRKYQLRYAVRRRTNTPDPAGDSVRLSVRWLTADQAAAVSTTHLETITDLTTSSGRVVREFIVSRTAGAGVVTAPSTAVYGRPYVQTFGSAGVTDIELVGVRDLTDTEFTDVDVTALSSRVTALETIDTGDRLSALEAGSTAPEVYRARTRADAIAASIPASVDYVETLAKDARSLREMFQRGGTPVVFTSADSATWSRFYGYHVRSTDFDIKANHDGTLAGGADDSAALEAFWQYLANNNASGYHSPGGARFARATGVDLGQNKSFVLRGENPRLSYIFVTGAVPYVMRFEDRVGLYTGSLVQNFVPDPTGYPQPPPYNYRKVDIRDVSFWGRGTNQSGGPIVAQGGFRFEGRHDQVFLDNVEFYNFHGPAIYMGYPNATGMGGIRESAFRHVKTHRCGSATKAAWIMAGMGATWSPNMLGFWNCEVAVSVGDSIHIRSLADANHNHALYFYWLKVHGTGPGTPTTEYGTEATKSAFILEGVCQKEIRVVGAHITQCGYETGQAAIKLVAPPLRPDVLVRVIENVASLSGEQTLDGILTSASRAFLDGQTNATENGLYLTSGGAWSRVPDTATADQFPGAAFKITSGTFAGKYYRYRDEETAPVIGTTNIVFKGLQYDYPQNFHFDGSVILSDTAFRIDGGRNCKYRLHDWTGTRTRVFDFGAAVDGPQLVEFQRAIEPMIIRCADGVSQHVELKCDSRLEALRPKNIWTQYQAALQTSQVTVTNTTATVAAGIPIKMVEAGGVYEFVQHLDYVTTSVAGIRFSMVFDAPPTSMSYFIRERPPGATDFTTSAELTAGTTNRLLAGGTGYGTIEIHGRIVNSATANNTLSIRFAQAVATVGANTTALRSSFYEIRKII